MEEYAKRSKKEKKNRVAHDSEVKGVFANSGKIRETEKGKK